jgi:hypothetical protein
MKPLDNTVPSLIQASGHLSREEVSGALGRPKITPPHQDQSLHNLSRLYGTLLSRVGTSRDLLKHQEAWSAPGAGWMAFLSTGQRRIRLAKLLRRSITWKGVSCSTLPCSSAIW